MKLDLVNVRKVLLCLEQNLLITEEGKFEEVAFRNIAEWCNLSVGETLNILLTLRDAGAITADDDDGDNRILAFDVYRLTYFGYQLLESLRPETISAKLKNAMAKGIPLTFDAIIRASTGFAVPEILATIGKSIP